MRHPSAQAESGIALVLALLAVAILSAATYRTLLMSEAHRETSRIFAHSQNTQQQLRLQIRARQESSRGCSSQRIVADAQGAQQWLVCSRGSPAWLATHPITLPAGRVDYDTLFSQPSSCQGEIEEHAPSAPFNSPRAAKTCRLPSSPVQAFTILDNIEGQDLQIASNDPRAPLTLATPGSISVSGAVSLPSSALIIAGGTIRIGALTSRSHEQIAVSLISAHGEIIIGSIGRGISALGLGRSMLALPPTAAGATTFVLPSFTQIPISGIAPGN